MQGRWVCEESEELRDVKYSWRRLALEPPTTSMMPRQESLQIGRLRRQAWIVKKRGSGYLGLSPLANKRVCRIIVSPKLSRGAKLLTRSSLANSFS